MLTDRESPYVVTTHPAARGWLSRLLKRSFPDRATQSIEAQLSAAFPRRIADRAVTSALENFGVSGKHARSVLHGIWAKVLTKFLSDDALSDEELDYLDALTHTLNLGWDEIQAIMAEVTHPRFQRAIAAVIADGNVTKEEREGLKELGARLKLPDEAQLKLYAESTKAVMVGAYREALDDKRFSPEEAASIEALAEKLGVDAQLDGELKSIVERSALLWRIENGQLPVIHAPINLQKGEICHSMTQVEWYELRTRTKRIDYAGPSGSIRIARGIRFRVGSITPRRVTAEELTPVDEGVLYITNKRLLFDGAKKNTTIRHSAVIGVQPLTDGLVLEKATGRSPHLKINGDTEMVTAILCGALAQV